MKVPYSQGVANQIGPKSCVRTSNRPGEALTGERVGRVLSREGHVQLRSADDLGVSEGNTMSIARREMGIGSARSEAPYMHGHTLRGNREGLCTPAVKDGAAGRIGKSKDARR